MPSTKTMIAAVAAALAASTTAPSAGSAVHRIPRLDTTEGLDLVTAQAEVTSWHGRRAIHLSPLPGQSKDDHAIMAVLRGTEFHDGVIELDVSGAPRGDADPTSRGFVGLAFRVQGGDSVTKFECCYIRPTNGRADDQLLRNHSLQYQEYPDYGWKKLREDSPGVYESYADLVPGEWTHLKLEVHGVKARLYVNGALQPALIVNDLKGGDGSGAIALWSYTSTEAYFSNLKVR
jgi:3-keto-disaccharide hydrolase